MSTTYKIYASISQGKKLLGRSKERREVILKSIIGKQDVEVCVALEFLATR
jgi:hypothetical protein